MITLKAIVPKSFLSHLAGIEQASLKELDSLADDIVKRMSVYPTAQPWKSRTPKTGLRKGGRRTGNYGRNWRKVNRSKGAVDVINPIRYAVWVGGPNDKGPGQTSNMKRRGWPSITDVGREEAKKHRPAMIRAVTGQAS